MTANVTLAERLQHLIEYIEAGRILEAMNEFYAEDVQMQENGNPPTVGLRANIERERQFLDSVKEWKTFEVKTSAVGSDVTFYECVCDWIATDDRPVHLEEAVVAKWRDGKITHETFYYDPSALPKPNSGTT
jgi:ketosteroid isomerase-like protein